MISTFIRLCLEQKLIVALFLVLLVGGGVAVAPFDWNVPGLPRDPVPVDAIPDLGENQQIVFTEWPGRSPQDVDDQITYPLTVQLLGVPGVKTVRSFSFFGFSSVYVVFEERYDFYDSRSRILERLSSLPPDALPAGVRPALGPDATALGQVFWYTLEGQDAQGRPTGGWDLGELRSVQDWIVRYGLLAADGISEVASVGGMVKEYQVDVDPDAMRAHGVKLGEVIRAVRESNLDVGARTIEVNRVEYVVRGLGFLKSVADLEAVVIKSNDNVPIRISDVAKVGLGPALRRGALDVGGSEAVGGVAVVRYGENPLAAIKSLKAKLKEISPGLPKKVVIDPTVSREELEAFAAARGFSSSKGDALNQEAWVAWASKHPTEHPTWLKLSQVKVVPFYDRTGLIEETLKTLSDALFDEILVCIVVVLLMVFHLRSALLISSVLPLGVLFAFITMRLAGVDANVVALAGIAIAIGTMVDLGIVLCENVLRHLDESDPETPRIDVIHRAATDVAPALLAAVATTIVSFLPVFALTGAEGKLFRPLAFTKTFALLGASVVAIVVIPPATLLLFRRRESAAGADGEGRSPWWVWIRIAVVVLLVTWLLNRHWLPLGPERGELTNFVFTTVLLGGMLSLFQGFTRAYPRLLRACLERKAAFLCVPAVLVVWGLCAWLGFGTVFAWVPAAARPASLERAFPGLGKEFMPTLDEGSFLYMPVTMPHASVGEALDALQKLDQALASVPEAAQVVGKIGRVESALDPAPIAMVETVVQLRPEFTTGLDGRRVRQWRPHIRTADDVWRELVKAARLPGTTQASKLAPIAARLVMLQSGMRAPMGIKVKGPDLKAIETSCLLLERFLKQVPGVQAEAVQADRVVGKPYLEIDIDRQAIARHGLRIRDVQNVIETAVGGRPLTKTVEGRERYPVRVRYQRELRDSVEALGRIVVPSPDGHQIPLIELAELRYARGPQAIKSEDTFLVGYILFDKEADQAEVDVIEAAKEFLEAKRASGELVLPDGVSYAFSGTYENQVRAEARLSVILPVALAVMVLILYLQFGSLTTTLIVFSGVLVAWAGGFIMLWFYGQPWFLDVTVFGAHLRTVFNVHPINLSVAVWVGFVALYGLADDDGVLFATYIQQAYDEQSPTTVEELREATILAGTRRIRPCLMTTATTALALIPVLTSTGRGSEIMVPMAIPSFGGMLVALITVFVVPVLSCARAERRLQRELTSRA